MYIFHMYICSKSLDTFWCVQMPSTFVYVPIFVLLRTSHVKSMKFACCLSLWLFQLLIYLYASTSLTFHIQWEIWLSMSRIIIIDIMLLVLWCGIFLYFQKFVFSKLKRVLKLKRDLKAFGPGGPKFRGSWNSVRELGPIRTPCVNAWEL